MLVHEHSLIRESAVDEAVVRSIPSNDPRQATPHTCRPSPSRLRQRAQALIQGHHVAQLILERIDGEIIAFADVVGGDRCKDPDTIGTNLPLSGCLDSRTAHMHILLTKRKRSIDLARLWTHFEERREPYQLSGRCGRPAENVGVGQDSWRGVASKFQKVRLQIFLDCSTVGICCGSGLLWCPGFSHRSLL